MNRDDHLIKDELIKQYGSVRGASKSLGIPRSTLRGRFANQSDAAISKLQHIVEELVAENKIIRDELRAVQAFNKQSEHKYATKNELANAEVKLNKTIDYVYSKASRHF